MIKLFMGKFAMVGFAALTSVNVGIQMDKSASIYNPFHTTEESKSDAFRAQSTAPCFVWIPDTNAKIKKVEDKK